jgi:IPT/TIG domain
MHTPKFSTKRVLGLAVAAAMAAGATIVSAGASEAAVAKLIVSPSSGSAGVARTITLTGSGFKVGSTVKVGTVGNGGVNFQSSTVACGSTVDSGASGYAVATARYVPTATKVIVTAPVLGATTDTTATKWNVCVYSTAGTPALLASGTYSTLGSPVINDAIGPVTGPAAGGGTVTIPGTNFGKTPKVYFGTVMSPKATVAKDGLSIDAIVPPQAAGVVRVSVVTDGGTNPTTVDSGATPPDGLATLTDDDYTYTNAIVVSDNTGPGAGTNDISISGVGFSDLDFTRTGGTGATDYGPSAVYLMRGAYTGLTNNTGAGNTTLVNPAAYTCASPIVLSDTELTCTLPAATDGAYTVTVVKDSRVLNTAGALGATQVLVSGSWPTNNATVVSASATYTVSAF